MTEARPYSWLQNSATNRRPFSKCRLHPGDRPYGVPGFHVEVDDAELGQRGRTVFPAQLALGRLGAAPAVLEDLGDVVLVGDSELAGHVGARRFGPLGYVVDDREGVRGGLRILILLARAPGFGRLGKRGRRAEQRGEHHKTH